MEAARRVRQSLSDIVTVKTQLWSREFSRSTTVDSPSHLRFFGVSALLFVSSAAATIAWCSSMSAMGEKSMPGGWSMSMMWMRMSGQSWPGTALSLLVMWVAMMVVMMLPSLSPMLWAYRRTIVSPVTFICLGYFAVWTVLGLGVFALGSALATLEMHLPAVARATPFAAGTIVVIAGAIQFTTWKACHLACCRDLLLCGHTAPGDAIATWRHGLRFGLHCVYCCASLMAILLVVGVMDLRAMALVTAAITAERLAPQGARAARAIGVVAVASGLLLLARASGIG